MAELPEPIREPSVSHTKLFINNEWLPALDGSTFPVFNPTTTKEICRVSKAKKADVNNAAEAAENAFRYGSEWRKMTPTKRANLLNKLADLIERDRLYIASLETFNNGKVFSRVFLSDLQLVINTFRYFAGWTDKLTGKTMPVGDEFFAYTKYEPIGVCGAIIPWNVPLIMLAWKAAPCLAAGNTLVLKPAEETPLTALYVASLVKEAGFPPGVFNIVPGLGEEAGAVITHHMGIDKISFTGSTVVGRLIQIASAESNFKRMTLEMGGKNPFIVFPDVKVSESVESAHVAIFSQGGQVCCAGSLTYVHEDIYEEFVKKSVERAKSRKLGDPFDSSVQQGPQISKKQQDLVLQMVHDELKNGGTLHCGGTKRNGLDGYFIEPAVLTDVEDNHTLAKEEIFGPVQVILKFKTVEEVIKRCNESHYGLAAGVYTNDLSIAMTIADRIRAGTVWINCFFQMKPSLPFGGYKLSGIGRDLGEESLRSYTEVKSVVMKKLAAPCPSNS